MFNCPGGCLGVSVMDLCLAELQALIAVMLTSCSPAFFQVGNDIEIAAHDDNIFINIIILKDIFLGLDTKPGCIQFQPINMQTFMAANNLYYAVSLPIGVPPPIVLQYVKRRASICWVLNGS